MTVSQSRRRFLTSLSAAGAVAFLRKPFNDELLIKTLRVVLN